MTEEAEQDEARSAASTVRLHNDNILENNNKSSNPERPPHVDETKNMTNTMTIMTATTTTTRTTMHTSSSLYAASAPATNESVLEQFGAGTRLYSHTEKLEANAREVLANKVILLYFSSSWCGPCKQFTPKLIELYQTLKTLNKHNEDFEIVYCGMDTMPCMHRHYASKMPWWSLPFQSTVIHKLSTMYNTSGIPHLVVLDRDGTLLQQDAVPQVMADPTGSDFPWRPKRLVDLLPTQYLRADGTLAPTRELDSKYVMIYASASWCPPCQQLTPRVARLYRELKATPQADNVEFLYLSSDRDQDEFNEFFRTMGFGAIPFSERKAASDIASLLNIRCVPTLAMFGPRPVNDQRCDRPLVNANVRDIFQQHQCPVFLASKFPFAPLTFGDLNRVSDDINSTKCIVIFCECCDDEEQEEIKAALRAAAGASTASCSGAAAAIRYFWACETTQLTKALRDMLNLGHPDGPTMVLLDMPSETSYYVAPTPPDITVESILNFAHAPGQRQRL